MNESKTNMENERSMNVPSAVVKPLVSLIVPAFNEAESRETLFIHNC